MIPKIAHQTSRTKALTPGEQRLHDKLKRILHDWQIILWDDEDNARMVEAAFPRYADAFNDLPHGVMKADLARYMYIVVHGGFYFDTDYEVLRYIDDDVRRNRCVLPRSREPHTPANPTDRIGLGNCVFGSEPGHPFWLDLLQAIFSDPKLRSAGRDDIMAVTGPLAVTRFYHDNLDRYPDVATPEKRAFHPGLSEVGTAGFVRPYGVHHCFGSWLEPLLVRRARTVIRSLIQTSTRALLMARP